MKILLSIILLATFSHHPPNKTMDTNQLLARWVINASPHPYSSLSTDDVEFVLHNSSASEKLPMHLKHGGISFLKDGVFIEHWWNKCGTGNPPSSQEGKWKMSDQSLKKRVTISGTKKWNGTYIIEHLDAERLRLKREI